MEYRYGYPLFVRDSRQFVRGVNDVLSPGFEYTRATAHILTTADTRHYEDPTVYPVYYDFMNIASVALLSVNLDEFEYAWWQIDKFAAHCHGEPYTKLPHRVTEPLPYNENAIVGQYLYSFMRNIVPPSRPPRH